jgi:sterol desaturase/sphingolipid hydroxylase (fatty acid hydroxylase superfamily)
VAIKVLLSLIFGFLFTEVVGYFFHRFLHSKKSGGLGKAHMTHHVKLYPPWDLYSDKYRDAGGDSTTLRFLALGVVIGVTLLVFTPFWFSVPMAFDLAFIGFLNDYIHTTVHLHPHFLGKFKLFRRLRALHMTHHLHVQKNLGILTFTTDRLFKTYMEPSSRKTLKIFP